MVGCDNSTPDTTINLDAQKEAEKKDKFLEEFEKFSLVSSEINATIYLPGEKATIGSAIQPNVEHEEGGFKWKLTMGEQFQITIDDWGREDMMADKRKALNGDKKYYEIEYIEDTLSFMSYKKKLKVKGIAEASKNVGVDHTSYHCYGQTTIEGINYVFSTTADGVAKPTLKYISTSIKSVTPNSILANP